VPEPNHYSTWFGGEHADWDIWGDGPFPFIDLRYFTRVMREVDALLPDAGIHVLATDDVRGPLPVSGDNIVVLCLNDEFGLTPAYSFDVRVVLKTMGAGRRAPYVAAWSVDQLTGVPLVVAQEAVVQVRRLPFLLRATLGTVRTRARPPVVDIPLGIRAFSERPVIPFGDRAYDVMFAGSLVNQPGEDERRLPSQKVRFRSRFLDALAETQRARPDVRFSVRTVESHWSALRAMGEYLNELSQARIVLCPRGSSLDTHRFFEALRFGCVPVYEAQPRRPYYRGSPAVRCRDWRRLPQVLDALLADPAGLEQRHVAALEWYERYVSPPAVGRQIAAAARATRSTRRAR
jgi:hypothetical protein